MPRNPLLILAPAGGILDIEYRIELQTSIPRVSVFMPRALVPDLLAFRRSQEFATLAGAFRVCGVAGG